MKTPRTNALISRSKVGAVRSSRINLEDLSPQETCFVIAPIGETDSEARNRSDDVFQYIIEPAAKANDLIAVRSDDISEPGFITNQIIYHILNDRMVVADLTDWNANVFYELGLRHAFRKPVVPLVLKGQKLPFEVIGIRTVSYDLNLKGATEAERAVREQIASGISQRHEVQSPVTVAASLDELRRSGETDLLKAIRIAGVTGIFKRRETAINAFVPAIDEEATEIMVIGSSLKGLLLKEEYKPVCDKLRFKCDRGLCKVKFLLTHPIMADLRAKQESRNPTEIGLEIIKSLKELRTWNQAYCHVKLYLGTPTCFAIKTTRKMLISPYAYGTCSYDSPCLIVEDAPEGGAERPSYFFDEFKTRHFGAWETQFSVPLTDFDRSIAEFKANLDEYSKNVQVLLSLAH